MRGLAVSFSDFVMELLSKVMSSSFTLSLKSFSSDQYLALMGDVIGEMEVFINSLFSVSVCKYKEFF